MNCATRRHPCSANLLTLAQTLLLASALAACSSDASSPEASDANLNAAGTSALPNGAGTGEPAVGGDPSGAIAGAGGQSAAATAGAGGVSTGVEPAAGGTPSVGGSSSQGGETSAGGNDSGGNSTPQTGDTTRCSAAGLEWKTARKTTYTSYPDPGSVECIEYNGCMWAGWFAGCANQQTEEWVEAHNIAAVFPLGDLSGHELCIKSGEQLMIVHVVDTCGDDDCNGCCTANQADNDALVDLESYTNARWGLPDSVIEWADLGPAPEICE